MRVEVRSSLSKIFDENYKIISDEEEIEIYRKTLIKIK